MVGAELTTTAKENSEKWRVEIKGLRLASPDARVKAYIRGQDKLTTTAKYYLNLGGGWRELTTTAKYYLNHDDGWSRTHNHGYLLI